MIGYISTAVISLIIAAIAVGIIINMIKKRKSGGCGCGCSGCGAAGVCGRRSDK